MKLLKNSTTLFQYEEVFKVISEKPEYFAWAFGLVKEAETAATIKLSEQISNITRDGMQEMGVFESETNSLRLTASDEVATLLDEIESLYSALFEASGKMMSDLVKITINNDQDLAKQNQEELNRLGELAKSKSAELREQMRNDLKQI